MTSKCLEEDIARASAHRLLDLKLFQYDQLTHFSNQFFGFRGEAACSIQNLCLMDIVTRQKSSLLTFTKTMKQGKCLNFGTSSTSRRPCGTTVSCHDLFFSVPVRRKCMVNSKCIVEIRTKIEAISLACPYIAFSLVDQQSSSILLHTSFFPKETQFDEALRKTFLQLYGAEKLSTMKPLSFELDQIKIKGLISPELCGSSGIQVA
jgi:DNA mismatch repair ATPase MutL